MTLSLYFFVIARSFSSRGDRPVAPTQMIELTALKKPYLPGMFRTTHRFLFISISYPAGTSGFRTSGMNREGFYILQPKFLVNNGYA
jgi:hypothetical protein